MVKISQIRKKPISSRKHSAKYGTLSYMWENGSLPKLCTSSRKVNEIQEQDSGIFLGTVVAEGDPWLIDIKIKDCEVEFKIDTGADVTFMPDHVFHEIFKGGNKPVLQRVTKLYLDTDAHHLV